MKPLSRRSVTTGLAAAVTAIPAVGLAKGAKEASELRGLIKTHRAAYRAFCKAISREEEMGHAYKKTSDTVIVPCLLGEGIGLSNGYEECQAHFAGAYENQRANALKQLSRVAPELAEQARAVMDAKEVENRELVDRVFAEEEARKEAFGLVGAERELEETGEAESDALTAVCAFRCRTLEEARLKADYLATAPGLARDGLQGEDVMALLQSFSATA